MPVLALDYQALLQEPATATGSEALWPFLRGLSTNPRALVRAPTPPVAGWLAEVPPVAAALVRLRSPFGVSGAHETAPRPPLWPVDLENRIWSELFSVKLGGEKPWLARSEPSGKGLEWLKVLDEVWPDFSPVQAPETESSSGCAQLADSLLASTSATVSAQAEEAFVSLWLAEEGVAKLDESLLVQDNAEALEVEDLPPGLDEPWLNLPELDFGTLTELGHDSSLMWRCGADDAFKAPLPSAEDLVGEIVLSVPSMHGEITTTGLNLTGAMLLLPLDDPCAVDWSVGLGIPRMNLLDLGVAALPSLWDLEGLAGRLPDWPHRPSSSLLCSSDMPAPLPVAFSSHAAALFAAGCWQRGTCQSEVADLPLPTALLPGLELPREAAALLESNTAVANDSRSLSFVGLVAPSMGVDRTTDVQHGSDLGHLASLLTSISSGKGTRFDLLFPSSLKGNTPTLLSVDAALPRTAGNDSWPVQCRNGSFKGKGAGHWSNLAAFSAARPSLSLCGFDLPLKCAQDAAGLYATQAAGEDNGEQPHAPNGGRASSKTEGVASDGTACASCPEVQHARSSTHSYEALPEEISLTTRLQRDAALVWSAYCDHAAVLSGDPSGKDLPEAAVLQDMLQQQTERYIRACAGGSEGSDDLDLYRLLAALHVLMTLFEEMRSSGVLQAIFCAEAFVAVFPSVLLRSNMWTNQALQSLHDLFAPTAASPSGCCGSSLSVLEPVRLCAFTGCRGCPPGAAAAVAVWGAERARVAELHRLQEIAAASGRRLVVIFASQRLLETLACAEAVEPRREQPAVVAALTPPTRVAQQLRQATVAFVHETAVAPPGSATSSPEAIAASWEVRRLLRQSCLVVAYQPLSLAAAVALTDLSLVPRAPPFAAEPVVGCERGASAECLTIMVATHLLQHQQLLLALEALNVRLLEREVLAASFPDMLLGPGVCCLLRGAAVLTRPGAIQEVAKAAHISLLSFDEVLVIVVIDGAGSHDGLEPVAELIKDLQIPLLPEGKRLRPVLSTLELIPALLKQEAARLRSQGRGLSGSTHGTEEMPQVSFLASLPGINASSAEVLLHQGSLSAICCLDATALHAAGMSKDAARMFQAVLDVPVGMQKVKAQEHPPQAPAEAPVMSPLDVSMSHERQQLGRPPQHGHMRDDVQLQLARDRAWDQDAKPRQAGAWDDGDEDYGGHAVPEWPRPPWEEANHRPTAVVSRKSNARGDDSWMWPDGGGHRTGLNEPVNSSGALWESPNGACGREDWLCEDAQPFDADVAPPGRSNSLPWEDATSGPFLRNAASSEQPRREDGRRVQSRSNQWQRPASSECSMGELTGVRGRAAGRSGLASATAEEDDEDARTPLPHHELQRRSSKWDCLTPERAQPVAGHISGRTALREPCRTVAAAGVRCEFQTTDKATLHHSNQRWSGQQTAPIWPRGEKRGWNQAPDGRMSGGALFSASRSSATPQAQAPVRSVRPADPVVSKQSGQVSQAYGRAVMPTVPSYRRQSSWASGRSAMRAGDFEPRRH